MLNYKMNKNDSKVRIRSSLIGLLIVAHSKLNMSQDSRINHEVFTLKLSDFSKLECLLIVFGVFAFGAGLVGADTGRALGACRFTRI